MEKRFATYKAFWPHYVNEHRQKSGRNLHFLGTSLGLLFVFLGVTESPWFLVLAPFVGYGFAWVAHLFVEKNRPATFTYPVWSLIADFHMFALMCAGRMDREVSRMGVFREENEA
jgi:hypothetical protein